MNENNITVTLTEAQHELILDVLLHSIECYHLMCPWDMGLHELPLDSEIIQRYTMMDNLREMFLELQRDRFVK